MGARKVARFIENAKQKVGIASVLYVSFEKVFSFVLPAFCIRLYLSYHTTGRTSMWFSVRCKLVLL